MAIFTEVMGYIGALFISIGFLPQTYKLFKTKNTEGLSLTCYLIYHLGLTLFIVYGAYTHNYPLLAANSFGWIVNFCLIFLICYNNYYQSSSSFKKKKNAKTKNGETNAPH